MMKRRSLLPQAGLNESLNVSMPIEEVDEEAERRGRVRIQRRQSLGLLRPGAIPGSGENIAPVVSTTSGYSATQLAEHYANCMKLSAENKINVKNAFNLGLIDYMAEMVRKKAPGMDNFQAASCALDASAKIYGYRVDALHTDTLKLAGGVGKTAAEAGVNPLGDGDQNEDGPEDGVVKKVRKRKNAGATIEKNVNNINLNKLDLEFETDPLFKKTSAQFDSGGGGGKFLCNLLTRDDACQLLLDSDAIQFMPGEKGTSSDDKINTNFIWPKTWPNKVEDDTLNICPDFVTFKFNDWSLEREELDGSFLAPTQKPTSHDASDDLVFDANAPMDFDDDGGIGADFVGADDFFDNDDANNGDVVFNDKRDEFKDGGILSKVGITDVELLKRHLSAVPNEYSYFDSGRLNSWRGPQHWKFSRPKFASTISVAPGSKPKLPKSKELVSHDFEALYTNDFNEDNLSLDFITKSMTIPKSAVKLQPKTMNTWTDDKLILPVDLHYSGKDFGTLYHCDFHVATKPIKQMSVDDSVADYDFNNENDVSNFCPDLGADNDGYDDDAGDIDGGEDGLLGVSDHNTSLVAAPNKVEKIQIGYAKQAKKMDMRRLKSIEWDLLTTTLSAEKVDKENDDTEMNVEDKTSKVEISKGETTFKTLYNDLHISKKMPAQMAQNLSVPLAFVALLHLCNENNLALKSRLDLTDFTIRQG